MPVLSISEALGQLAVIDLLIEKKQQLISAYLFRDAAVRDPLERHSPGAVEILAREYRSIQALLGRKVRIRRVVQSANEQATITHGDTTRSIADWLVWKREVVGDRSRFLQQLRNRIEQARREALRHRPAGAEKAKGGDLVVNLNEQELSSELEALEELQGYLAGQLALKNATVTVELPGDEAWKTGLEERLDELLARAGQAAPSKGLAVWLLGLSNPAAKIAVIKLVREITGCGLAEARSLVDNAPKLIKEAADANESEQLRQRLEAAGARVELR
jgi:ribosomal protein L7/L12